MVSKAKAIEYLKNLVVDSTTTAEMALISFIRRCVEQFTEKDKIVQPRVDLSRYFEPTWKIYKRKINKTLAIRTYEHKMRGLTEEQVKEKATMIYKAVLKYNEQIEDNETELNFVAHFSSFLNNNVPNSPHYKGVR
ncbi:MAG: hypothetical protein EOL97_09800 [Spirochaetia bacterium]|nr:hypothetical protein [Spirochaetia bacterium]